MKRRANARGLALIAGRLPHQWNKFDNRNLIRLNRICEGEKPFSWGGKPRLIKGVYECQVTLYSFGNITRHPGLRESYRDLLFYNRLMEFSKC
jgi:hypothetical protein